MSGVEQLPPVCDEASFRVLGDYLAQRGAPRLFAVVQEYGRCVNAHVAAYGMAFEDRVVMLSNDGRDFTFTLSCMESAVGFYHREEDGLTARVVWLSMLDDAEAESEETFTAGAVRVAA
ncbi:hypothetical protein [Saccharothrix syringae]|uniref:hypothetical protein n=1 Tax=Saccharothrix syringae TaxID=103733 RepID=UPI00068A6A1D|nr:hypothetical protein [Saccharothrix syringae]